MSKTLLVKCLPSLLFVSFLATSCTVYNYYDYDSNSEMSSSETSSSTSSSSEEYIPTQQDIDFHNDFRTRTYQSVLKNPNFEEGIKIIKRRASVNNNVTPMYYYNSDTESYAAYPRSSNKRSNEHINYDDAAYLIFDENYENEMDACFDPTYNYPEYVTNSFYKKVGNNYEEVVPSDYTSRYYTKNSTIPNPSNGRSLSCDNDMILNSWYISEWWRPDEGSIIHNSSYKYENGVHKYVSQTREVDIDNSDGSMRIVVDAGAEFGIRTDDAVDREHHVLNRADKWPHFLIEQTYTENPIYAAKAKHVYIDFDFTLNSIEYTGLVQDSDPESYRNAAQIYLYLSVADYRWYSSGGKIKAMWIGMPIYDSRYNAIRRSLNVDEGFDGATNRIIYKASNTEYFEGIDDDHPMEVGKTYKVHYDILPLIKDAFVYASNYDSSKWASMAGRSWDDIVLYYMNYGYELPGAYKLDSTISNMDIYSTR